MTMLSAQSLAPSGSQENMDGLFRSGVESKSPHKIITFFKKRLRFDEFEGSHHVIGERRAKLRASVNMTRQALATKVSQGSG